MYKITIPGNLPDLNTIIKESKRGNRNWQPYNEIKKENTDKVTWIVKAKIKKELNKIDLDITWICKNKMKDKDNIMVGTKFILDGFVNAGIIKNDGWKQIGNISHKFEVDKNNPRIEIEIKEVEKC